jgi:cytidine deaminase
MADSKGPVDLTEVAKTVQANAYAPYSKFKVGAAIVMTGGSGTRYYTGVNVENASYPLSVCAERNAIAAACADGARELQSVCVFTDASPPSAPCGGCRQVLSEFAPFPHAVRVVAVNGKGETRRWTLAELLPDSFSGKELP